MRALLCLAFLPGLRSFAPTPRRHRIQLKSVEDVHGDEVLAPTEELSTPSSDFVSDLRKNATRQKHAIGYGSSTTYDKTSLTNELPYASATPAQTPKRESRVFCSRDLKLENIKVIGYDMDYTIVHYKWREWEALAYACAKACLEYLGFPVSDLEFDDPDLACRGLVIDTERGNFLKIDRHGFVRRAMHGKRRLGADELEELYGRKLVDLRDRRFSFLNTLFSVSEGVLYSQLVSKLDSGALVRDASPPFDASKVSNYADLYRAVSSALARAHGGKASPSEIKEAVFADPARYTQREPEKLRRMLADQRRSGKKLALITNSDWWYTDTMMRFVCGDDLEPSGADWRDLFDVVVCSARKPAFFTTEKLPFYELALDEVGSRERVAGSAPLLREAKQMRCGRVYCGGSARLVEKLFNSKEDELLYVGDHLFTDANAVKASMRWRTALVVQELDLEIRAAATETRRTAQIDALLGERDNLESELNVKRLALERWDQDRQPSPGLADEAHAEEYRRDVVSLRAAVKQVDDRLEPLLARVGEAFNRHWGYLTRAGHDDKSHIARQIEKYADVYCAKVTNLDAYTPFHHFRAAPVDLAHTMAAATSSPDI